MTIACSASEPVGRREFLRAGLLAGGAGLLTAVGGERAWAAGKADALLLSCMDYRLVDDTERYMAGRGLRDKYDHVILAGASLGALTDRYPAWSRTFWEHLDAAIELHQIHTVLVMDHRDCGAYKLVLGDDLSKDPGKETAVHAGKLRELADRIRAQHPKLQVELLLMSLDGKVEEIAPRRAAGDHRMS
jgi:carbonic anhydrase